MEKLQRGQVVMINSEKYIVDNMIEFKEGAWIWQEYEVKKQSNNKYANYQQYWLTIELDENNQKQYFLYTTYGRRIFYTNTQFKDNGKNYELYESGTATVNSHFGPTDVDFHEKCQYYDYISEDKEEILSVEIWSDGTEYTKGKKIKDYQIQIVDEIDNEYLKNNKKLSGRSIGFISILGIILFFLPFISAIIPRIFVNKSIDKYLSENTSKYTYVTSVTNNSNNKKAKVYRANTKTLDETIKDIIDGVPEGITEVIDDDSTTEQDGYALETENEYAYIYMHQDEKIYIQVSEKEFVNSSGTTYHSSHNTHYHRSYSRRSRSSLYYNYASSARQSSINSRSYSGGGTSSGK